MATTNTPITCSFTGQSLIHEPLSPVDEGRFESLRRWINESSVRFTNFEITVTDDRPAWPMREKNSTIPSPEVIDDIEGYGFNLLSLANNHAWDAGVNGVLDTLENVEDRGIPHAGIGRDLPEAQEPARLEVDGGSVALVAMSTGGVPESAYATERQRGGRPGINPLVVDGHYELPPDEYEAVEDIVSDFAGEYMLWDDHDRAERLLPLYRQDPSITDLFRRGSERRLVRDVDEADRTRHTDVVEEAAESADLVLVYLHHHHWELDPREVGDWLQNFAKQCIDSGCDAFVTHGVPLVLPIEIYRGKPIFYSLGNFIFHALEPGAGWYDPGLWKSVAVRGSFSAGSWGDLELRPVVLDEGPLDEVSPSTGDSPLLADDQQAAEILTDLKESSRAFGTEISVADGTGRVHVDS